MIKLVFFVARRSDLSFEQFKEHALSVHAPLVAKLPGLRKFVLNLRQPIEAPGQLPCDAMPEFWFDSMAQFQQALFGSPEGEEVRRDRAAIMDEAQSQWLAVEEHSVFANSGLA